MYITYNFLEIQQLKEKIENSREEKETLAKESDILAQGGWVNLIINLLHDIYKHVAIPLLSNKRLCFCFRKSVKFR